MKRILAEQPPPSGPPRPVSSLSFFGDPARPKSRTAEFKPGGEGYANEGGEWILSKSHRAVQLLDEARAATCLKAARGGNRFDGFVPCVFHMRGFSVAVFSFYGIPGVGMSNDSICRFKKLGSLLRAIQLPWIICAEWNFTPSQLQRTGFLVKVGRQTICADAPHTCTPGGGKTLAHLDLFGATICSECAGSG